MSPRVPAAAAEVLERGAFCAIAASTARGPHVTPLVFAWSSGRVWLTTSRGSVKARAWRREPRTAGLVREGDRAVAFVGSVRLHDVLEPSGWVASTLSTPALVLASSRFTRKNARFFAGYAVDARRVPLAWTPPGRVFVEVRLEGGLLLERDRVVERWGRGSRRAATAGSRETFRASRTGRDALQGLPEGLAERLGRSGGDAAVALETPAGLAAVPAAWAADGEALYAAVPADALAAAGAAEEGPAALMIDRASWWRARDMVGAMAAGSATIHLPDALRSGARSATERIRATGAEPEGSALVRLRPDRIVWWSGWSSGTVGRT